MLSPGGNACALQIRPIVHVTSLFGSVDSILKVMVYLSVAELLCAVQYSYNFLKCIKCVYVSPSVIPAILSESLEV